MAPLTALPNEILILVYCKSPIESAVRLSAVNKRFHDIWTEHNDSIVSAILQPVIPAYEDALSLALIETRSNEGSSPPISKWLPRLLYNAELASSVCEKFATYLQNLDSYNYRHALHLAPLPPSYYMIRKLVLAYDPLRYTARDPAIIKDVKKFLQDHPVLHSEMGVDSLEKLESHSVLCEFMHNWMEIEERIRHGIYKPEEFWTIEDELIMSPCNDEWMWADNVTGVVLVERKLGRELEDEV